jgi:hypothetical protein
MEIALMAKTNNLVCKMRWSQHHEQAKTECDYAPQANEYGHVNSQ